MSLTKNIPSLNIVRSFHHQMDDLGAPDCFSRPCVMSDQNRQLWWPKRCREGSQKIKHHRKGLYKTFCTMLCHRGLWQDERYLARKSVTVCFDSRHRRFVWQSHAYKREIMPDCVVRQVRD